MRRNGPAIALLLATCATTVRAGTANQVRKDAFRLLNEGVAAYNRAAYREAIPPLTQAASMSLNSFRVYYFLGLSLAGDRRYADAIESYKIALDLDPNHLQANVAMADAWLSQGDADEANPFYTRAMKLRAEYAPALDGLARVAEAQADEEKAAAYFARALASDKGYAPAYMHLGDMYLRQGKLDEAVKLLSEAVSVRPDFGAGLDRLSIAYGRLGFSNEAVATIRKAIDLEPKNPAHHATLGEVLLGMGVTASAEASFRTAIAIDPAQPQARAGLAELERRRGAYDKALAELDLALADPRIDVRSRHDLTTRRAAIVAEQARSASLDALVAAGTATADDRTALASLEAGRGNWNRAAEIAGTPLPQGAALETLGFYLFRAGRYRDAHAVYAALAEAGGRADMEVNAGACLARLGDAAGAKAAFDRALAIDKDQPQAQLYRANALLRLGDTAGATEAYRLFVAGHPSGGSTEQVKRVLAQIAP